MLARTIGLCVGFSVLINGIVLLFGYIFLGFGGWVLGSWGPVSPFISIYLLSRRRGLDENTEGVIVPVFCVVDVSAFLARFNA